MSLAVQRDGQQIDRVERTLKELTLADTCRRSADIP